jgi:prephenate dehydrogenase
MTIEVAIIGLGQIGASIGLALADKPDLIHRTGFDLDGAVAREAKKRGVMDVLARDLPSAVEDAGLVILSLPTDQIRETLEWIAPHLKESSVVMDTAPVKETIVAWARELLPAGRYYVGLTPVLNPAYLQAHESGIEGAHPDLFRGGMMVVVAPPDTPSEAVKLSADLARLLGAATLFADPLEVDSMMASTHIVPQLLAAALLNITVDQPGWREGARIAGRAYSEVTGPIVQLGEPGALSSAAMLARENVIRITGSLIAALQSFRSDLEHQDVEALTERLERARAGRESWWKQRQITEGDSQSPVENMEMPKASDAFAQLLGLGRRTKKKK